MDMELMTIDQVKDFFSLKKRKTIDDWLNRGTLNKDQLTIKVGGRRFFIKQRLIEFLNTKTANY